VLQQKLGLTLCSPDDELLLQVPSEFLKRKISQRRLGENSEITFPSFVKPVVPKQFRGAVYQTGSDLAAECHGLPPNAAVFVSEPVTLAAEARTFVMDGRVLDTAVYEGDAEAAALAYSWQDCQA
jgi:hypothetical protein